MLSHCESRAVGCRRLLTVRRSVRLSLVSAFGGGVAAPSANRFGLVSPTTADQVRAELGDAIDFVLVGGSFELASRRPSSTSRARFRVAFGPAG